MRWLIVCLIADCARDAPFAAFLTDISEGWPDGMHADVKARAALDRAAQPEEIVGTVLYLAGEASSFTTGALLAVDGGWV